MKIHLSPSPCPPPIGGEGQGEGVFSPVTSITLPVRVRSLLLGQVADCQGYCRASLTRAHRQSDSANNPRIVAQLRGDHSDRASLRESVMLEQAIERRE